LRRHRLQQIRRSIHGHQVEADVALAQAYAAETERLLVSHDVPRVEHIVSVSVMRDIHLFRVRLKDRFQFVEDSFEFCFVRH
jgi:hypothetical protein